MTNSDNKELSPEARPALPTDMLDLVDAVRSSEGEPADVADFRALTGLFHETIDGIRSDHYIKGTGHTRSSGDLRDPNDASGPRTRLVTDPMGELVTNQYRGMPAVHFYIEQPGHSGKARDRRGDMSEGAWGVVVRVVSVGGGRVIATVSGKSSVEGAEGFLPDGAGPIHTASKELIGTLVERVGEPGDLESVAAPTILKRLLGRFASLRG